MATARPIRRRGSNGFGIRHFVAGVVAVYFFIMLYNDWGRLPALLFLSLAALGMGAWLRWTWLIIGGPVAICLLVLFSAEDYGYDRTMTRKTQCENNLKQIALAMHLYHDAYGSFPPAYVGDEDGRPMHSWRVLLLPFLEERELYEAYDFDQPWDSRANQALTQRPIPIFTCPSDIARDDHWTNYVVVTGEDTVFPGRETRSIADIRDGSSNTILIVEVAGSGIPWAAPYDLSLDELDLGVNTTYGGGISSFHTGGAMVAMADGSVQFLPAGMNAFELKALLTASGGENKAATVGRAPSPSFVKKRPN